jgi:methionyl-tRNA formyltransferase
MKKMSNRIVFFGNERRATGVNTTCPTLKALLDEGYDVVAVVSNFERGTSRSARSLEIAEVAEKHQIPLLLPDKPSEVANELRAYGAEVAVLVAYGKIVPQSVIDIFPRGIVNIHPSLLPLHRGPTPLESVILDGSSKTGVSLMQLAKAMDAGPVFGQSEVELKGDETKQELADRLLEIGSQMVVELLPGILDSSVVALPQDDSRATYDELLTKDQGLIDWDKPAKQLGREVRAYAEWPRSRATIGGKEVIVLEANVLDAKGKPGAVSVTEEKQLLVATSEGSLIIERLKPAGKNEMTAKEFLTGYGQNLY